MSAGRNGVDSRRPHYRVDRGEAPGGGRGSRPWLGPRARAIVLAALLLFLAYESTVGPWRGHQVTAESYALRARRMAELAGKERRLAASGGGREAARHRRNAWYYSRLAADSAAMGRAHRRLAWNPWGSHPPDPLPPDPLAPGGE